MTSESKKKMAKKKSSKKASGRDKNDDPIDFESSLADVEEIVAQLESGELGLTESLEQYERGIKQLKRCHALLDAAEQRVSLLSGFDADGNPITKPMRKGSATTSKGKKGADNALKRRRGGRDVDDMPELF